MQGTIADRLGQCYREAVHVTVDREVDVVPVLAPADVADVSITDVILQGVSETLSEHPSFTATFDADAGTYTLYEKLKLGLVVDIAGGFVTPVLSDVESKTPAKISAARGAMTERVLEDEFTADDLPDGTFTVSNLGGYNSDSFTPIIKPPEIAIPDVNRLTERPVRPDRGIEFRRHVTFSHTFDRRVVDGADTARFQTTLDERLWDPLADRPYQSTYTSRRYDRAVGALASELPKCRVCDDGEPPASEPFCQDAPVCLRRINV